MTARREFSARTKAPLGVSLEAGRRPGRLILSVRLMSAEQQQVLFENTAHAMGDAPREIKLRTIGNCKKPDPGSVQGVAQAMAILLSEVPKAA